jgi:8-oxo-dGTP pyrophosphatase MutT (NUDIX family)
MPHEVTAALIIQSQKILLGLRSATRTFYPDVWDLFGGHVEPGESHEETLVRELHEELGITPTKWTFLETLTLPAPTVPPPNTTSDSPESNQNFNVGFGGPQDGFAQGARHSERRGSELIVHLYLVTAWKGTPYNRQPEEHSVIHWFSLAEAEGLRLADPIYPTLFARYLDPE